ncbi:outer membrane protein [Shewanella surugensis]|uniref:Outer membrane beta-barrel protein n=1 Tax=Shewanella surugensis TaxID=212020 RepID=A0ABT0L9G0_9GAMM|nr:outer membrane beta-barrel protein [Shewanella surugensis]MCL1124351.1 outer membrane beta-barrel protein [Shewanella surugensis]
MKNIKLMLLISSYFLASLFSTLAIADHHKKKSGRMPGQAVYAQLSVGANFQSNQDVYYNGDVTVREIGGGLQMTYDPGLNFGGALGYQAHEWRVAFSIDHYNNDMKTAQTGTSSLDSTKSSATTYLGNLYYDWKIKQLPIKPFIGVGLGLIGVNMDISNYVSQDDYVMAYQLTMGFSYDINHKLKLSFEYKHLNSTELSYEIQGGSGYEDFMYYQINSFGVNMSYRF